MWYRTGTLSLVINNSKVTGTGTKWADAINGVMPGMMLLGPDWKLYEIKSVESNTALTLASNYLGATANGQAYAIITTYEGDLTQFSARFSAILTSLQGSKGDLSTWLTGTGDCQLTKDDGTTIKVPTLSKIQADYLSRTTLGDQTIAGAVNFSKVVTSKVLLCAQATAPEINAILRFIDADGVQQGALYNTTTTGDMTLRWGGVKHSLLMKADGSATFPGDIYSGSVKVATQSTSLGIIDLNTVKTEGDYYQTLNINATDGNHYPNGQAGVLRVLNSRTGTSGQAYITQLFYPYKASDFYYQRLYDAGTTTWTDWDVNYGRNKNDARYLQIGSYGLGADFRPALSGYTLASDYRINGAFYGNLSSMTDTFGNTNNHVLNVSGYVSRTHCFQMAFPLGLDRMAFRRIQNNDVRPWMEVWHTGNTTVDANGFIKKASPIVKLFGTGECVLNEQSQGVTTERISEGIYRISGVLGFNSDGAWGERGSGVEIPMDDNKRPLIWIESKVLPDGDIEIRTYHRTYDTGPYSARNIEAMDSGEVDKKKQPIFVEMPDGTPIDIPAGRFIDLRVEMPAVDEPESEAPVEPIVPEFTPEPEAPVSDAELASSDVQDEPQPE